MVEDALAAADRHQASLRTQVQLLKQSHAAAQEEITRLRSLLTQRNVNVPPILHFPHRRRPESYYVGDAQDPDSERTHSSRSSGSSELRQDSPRGCAENVPTQESIGESDWVSFDMVATIVAGPHVDRIGVGFLNLPPVPLVVKRVTRGSWADQQGIQCGDEFMSVDHRRSRAFTPSEFTAAMKKRPLVIKLRRTARKGGAEAEMQLRGFGVDAIEEEQSDSEGEEEEEEESDSEVEDMCPEKAKEVAEKLAREVEENARKERERLSRRRSEDLTGRPRRASTGSDFRSPSRSNSFSESFGSRAQSSPRKFTVEPAMVTGSKSGQSQSSLPKTNGWCRCYRRQPARVAPQMPSVRASSQRRQVWHRQRQKPRTNSFEGAACWRPCCVAARWIMSVPMAQYLKGAFAAEGTWIATFSWIGPHRQALPSTISQEQVSQESNYSTSSCPPCIALMSSFYGNFATANDGKLWLSSKEVLEVGDSNGKECLEVEARSTTQKQAAKIPEASPGTAKPSKPFTSQEKTKSSSQSFYAYGPPGTPHSDFVRIVSSKLPYHARPERPSRTLNDWIASTTSVPEVLALVASYGSEFDGTNTATALHRLAKWHREVPDPRLFQDSRWRQTLDHLDRNLQAPAFQTRHLTSSLWSFATMGWLIQKMQGVEIISKWIMIQFRIQMDWYCDYSIVSKRHQVQESSKSTKFNDIQHLPTRLPTRLQAQPFFRAMSQSFPMQPTLTSQPSANLSALIQEDSQKFHRKETVGFDEMIDINEVPVDPHEELLFRLSQLYKNKEVHIEELTQEVQRLQGKLLRMSMANAADKSILPDLPPTPQAKPEDSVDFSLEADAADGEEVPKERTEPLEHGNSGDVPPSSSEVEPAACKLPSDFFNESRSELGQKARKVELLPRWAERVSWENSRIAVAPPSQSNFEDRRLESCEGTKDTVERRGCQRFILLPSDPKRMIWDLTGMVLLVYDMIVIPISAFEPEETTFTAFMEWLTQIFWTFDVVMSLLTGYVHKGQLVMSPWAILINYLKTWFVLDLVVVGPDWVMTFIQLSAPSDEEGGTSVSRLMRSIRVVRTVRLLRLVKLKRVIDMAKDRITSEVVFILLNILKLIVLLLLVNHFVASLWYLMGGLGNPGQLNWRDVYRMQPQQESIEYRYATALHWSLTQFTPATVDVHPQNMVERTFAILVLIFGLVLFSSFVSSITASMTQLRNMQEDKSKQFWLLRRYLLQKKVPQELNFKVLRYTEYATSRSGEAIPEHRITILNVLTKQLQSELRFVTHFGCVKQHGFFKLVSVMNESVLHMMSGGKALHFKALAAQDPLFEIMDLPTCMYFVEQGQVQYTQGHGGLQTGTFAPSSFESENFVPPDPDLIQPTTPTEGGIAIGKGGHLCEIVLWANWKHVGSARAIYESNIVQVNAKGFGECIRRDPAIDSMAAMYARMFVKVVNDPDRILDEEQEICNDQTTALADSLKLHVSHYGTRKAERSYDVMTEAPCHLHLLH
eukprot:s2093_g13.t2